MAILTRDQLQIEFEKKNLISNAREKTPGVFDIEAASYDLSAGIAVIKHEGMKVFSKRVKKYKFITGEEIQDTVTLNSGQMMFVITNEELNMPANTCATVYSRNSLAQKGVLALNAGHVDPGYQGPITIKLINLRNTKYTLCLGEPIFTIVFNKFDKAIPNLEGQKITRDETLKRVLTATDLSLDNALYDLALLNNFIKKGEIGKEYLKWIKTSIWGMLATILTILGGFVTISKLMDVLEQSDWYKKIFP